MLSVELAHMAKIFMDLSIELPITAEAITWSGRLKRSVEKFGTMDEVYLYEVNGAQRFLTLKCGNYMFISITGYGGRYIMDDANVPVRDIDALF